MLKFLRKHSKRAASIDETRTAINTALHETGGVYAEYGCETVSWDDVARGEVNGNLSCWGANITDTYLKGKDGSSLFTVRSQNWNEKLGVVRATDVALLIGNCDEAACASTARGDTGRRMPLRNVTLQQFLAQPAAFGANYAGLSPRVSLADEEADKQVSIRFQTVFLPVEDGGEEGKETFQFATEAYNYNTTDDKDPRNLVVLATTQGLSVQQDGCGAKRLLLHARDGSAVSEYWLEAESSKHKIGSQQLETAAEREDALRRGKATSETIGIRAMGKRFNVLMTIQIPLTQAEDHARLPGGIAMGGGGSSVSNFEACFGSAVDESGMDPGLQGSGLQMESLPLSGALENSHDQDLLQPVWRKADESDVGSEDSSDDEQDIAVEDESVDDPACKLSSPTNLECFTKELMCDEEEDLPEVSCSVPKSKKKKLSGQRTSSAKVRKPPPKKGKATAARVSRGDYYGPHTSLTLNEPMRNSSEHVTISCVFYATVAGGVPSSEDVISAVEDMEKMYAACTESGRLADESFDFMKGELTVGQMQDIHHKVYTKPNVVTNPPAPDPRQASDDMSPSRLLESKFDALMLNPSREAALEIKLMALGAIAGRNVDLVELITSKFDSFLDDIPPLGPCQNFEGRVLEMKLLVQGAVGDEI